MLLQTSEIQKVTIWKYKLFQVCLILTTADFPFLHFSVYVHLVWLCPFNLFWQNLPLFDLKSLSRRQKCRVCYCTDAASFIFAFQLACLCTCPWKCRTIIRICLSKLSFKLPLCCSVFILGLNQVHFMQRYLCWPLLTGNKVIS